MSDLTALIERVGKLTGPDREVDALLWAFFDNRMVRDGEGFRVLARSNRPPHDECILFVRSPIHGIICDRYHKPPLPAYTRSLDDVVRLVKVRLPGAKIMVNNWPGGNLPCAARVGRDSEDSRGPTLAIALLSALLRALEQEGR